LIIFDRFKLENANEVVFAKSGAGKSYAVKLDILRSMMLGSDVIILDPENEYETLTRTVGGTYVKISLNSDQRINPFDLPKSMNREEHPGESLREAAINIAGLMGLMLGKLTPTEQGLLDKSILQTYEMKGITTETVNPHEYEMPTMVDLENSLRSMEGGKDLATRLERFTKGTFSGLFSDQTNVDLGTGLVTFSIRDLEDQLRPISMYILLNFIWNEVRSKLKKRLLVIDEAWNIVQHEDSGRFLHGLVKRARKYYLGITTITQDVEDFLDSPWGKPIITNSSLQLLLRQSPVATDKLVQVFNLTEQEKYLLLNSGVGQGLFFAGNQHVAIQIIASYNENKIITTNPEELLKQK
jgi:type IV secretory pathway VirB4 component